MIVGVDPALVLVKFGVELAHLVGRESQVLLGVAHLLVETGVLLKQIVDLLLESVVLLVVGSDPVLVVVEFLRDLGVLVGRQTQVLLGVPHLVVDRGVLVHQASDFLLQCSDGLVHVIDFGEPLVEVAQIHVLLLQHSVQSFDLL